MNMFKATFLYTALFLSNFALAQSCYDEIKSTSPTDRYTVNSDGTILDKQTSLLWSQCSVGQAYIENNCVGSASSYTWEDAFIAADAFELADKSSWRIPNIKELASIVESQCIEPSLNNGVFEHILSSTYWSSTPSQTATHVWYLNFQGGTDGISSKHTKRYLLLVTDANSQ